MDVNHRGGPTGFVRILPSPSPSSPTTLVYPEYSGNRLYQTLGNLHTTPLASLCIPDFTTGDVLYATGTTAIHTGHAASALLPRSNLAISITLTSARLVRHGLSFRGTPSPALGSAAAEPTTTTNIGMSPYNPPVRLLAAEGNPLSTTTSSEAPPLLTATLTTTTPHTPTIATFTFTLSTPTPITPGQWVALDASAALATGYSHMRDDDPTSLNDDFIRTFTVASASAWPPSLNSSPSTSFSLTLRHRLPHGALTSLLFSAPHPSPTRAGLDLAVRGFGGEFHVTATARASTATPFVTAGVGVTPLLAALAGGDVAAEAVALFWTLRVEDVGVAEWVFGKWPGLRAGARVFLTGEGEAAAMEGVRVERRRMGRGDLEEERCERWYLCVGTGMRKEVLGWLEGRGEVVFEDFNF